MSSSMKGNNRMSIAMERTGQWIFSQDIPTDVVVAVGEAHFPLHKFMLVAKSNYIRKLIMESTEADLTRIDLTDIPGGAEIFEKAAKFCYGVNFEITVHNVAALRCAAEYLQMTDKYCDNNLIGRTEDFLSQVALSSLSGAIVVLKSSHLLLPMAEDLYIVHRCVDVISSKACNEANFPSRSPPNWWTEELTIIDIEFFAKIITAMKSRGAKASTLSAALITYAERSLRDLVRDHSGTTLRSSTTPNYSVDNDSDTRIKQRHLLESIVSLLPSDKAAFPIHFLCCLLRSAIYLKTSTGCKNELEKRISMVLEHLSVDDLLMVSFTYDGERLVELESIRRIIMGFVEKEKSVAVFNAGDLKEICSVPMQRVAKTVDAYLGEIATYGELSISKFNGIANIIPKFARKVDDDLYRAIDIYLKAHPNLDEIEREKVCSVMDPLKLSYEARVHASQNKRLPVQIVLHALYYDQLKLRSGTPDDRKSTQEDAATMARTQAQADVSLVKENEALRSELMKMKLYISDMQKSSQGTSSIKVPTSRSKGTFFSSVSKTLGKLNPFRHGSKDTSNIDDGIDITKPRRRRFSIS
ncbi:root phototropism protein 2 [Cucumis sativus]|nr:root phototropism protein 2 [Cucumis sativus]XP_011653251.1 root phototropism protein 2 [Cucumis sativus]XP_031740221.1 root phototropism protein 2 [Cucumis sativus]